MKCIKNSDIVNFKLISIQKFNLNFFHKDNSLTFDEYLTPLIIACFSGKIEIILTLLNNEELNVNLGSKPENFSPLMVSIYKGYYEISKLLIENGADVNQSNSKGHYPILFSFSRLEENNYQNENKIICLMMIELLLSNGADINVKCGKESTQSILMKLISNESNDSERNAYIHKLIKFLLERGADKSVVRSDGKDIYSIVKEKNNAEEKEILLDIIANTSQIVFYKHYNNPKGKHRRSKSAGGKEHKEIVIEDKRLNMNCCAIF